MNYLITGKSMKTKMLILLLSCLFFSCVRELVETKTLVIESSLDNMVSVEFYSDGLPSGPKKLTINGKGKLYEHTEMVRGGVTMYDLLQVDSILLIFDNQKIEPHSLINNSPIGNSLFESDSYKKNGNIITYTIDLDNFSNATPCDGVCK